MMFVEDREQHPAEIVSKISYVLDLLADMAGNQNAPELELSLSYRGVEGFIFLLRDMSDTLEKLSDDL